jgi:hypothetical protein
MSVIEAVTDEEEEAAAPPDPWADAPEKDGVKYLVQPGAGTNGDNCYLVQMPDGALVRCYIDPEKGIEAHIADLLDPQEPPARRLVTKSLIISRLHEAGLLAAAKAALEADLYARERWYAPDRPAVYADDAETLALLSHIGADAAVILAP